MRQLWPCSVTPCERSSVDANSVSMHALPHDLVPIVKNVLCCPHRTPSSGLSRSFRSSNRLSAMRGTAIPSSLTCDVKGENHAQTQWLHADRTHGDARDYRDTYRGRVSVLSTLHSARDPVAGPGVSDGSGAAAGTILSR